MLKSIVAFCLTHRAVVLFALLFFGIAGYIAYEQLNIEAYPNPTPVILEITAQAPGLSADEMERYYTRPIEIGLYRTPGVSIIRSTSFYGLSFVSVTFKWGINYDYAFAQASISMQQNVTLPGGQVPSIQASNATGEIFRYQVTGPPHFGITNLRTVEDWIIARRLLTIPGIAAVNSWGGPTKEFEVEADPEKLQSYNITVPQIITALGNANINVGGREIRIGQQSINIRGIGLIDDGGDDDLTKGYNLSDIQNVVLSEHDGTPILVKDVATVSVGFRPRLGIFGIDSTNDAVAAIVVMRRTEKTNEILPEVRDAIADMNRNGSLPPGVKIVPFYDRGSLIAVTTDTVVHNLIFGIILVFLIQWIFLGDLRSAIIVGINIPFALLFAVIIIVLNGESANLLSIGAVDLGIIVESGVILVENTFRNFGRSPDARGGLLSQLSAGYWGTDPTQTPIGHAVEGSQGWTDRLRLILVSAMEIDKAVLFSVLITVAAFVPLFTMQGVEGQIFGPMARTYGYALAGALIATFTITPVLSAYILPKHVKETETWVTRMLHKLYDPALHFTLNHRWLVVGIEGAIVLGTFVFIAPRLGSEFLPHLEEGNFWIRASMPTTISLQDGEAAAHKMREILMKYPEIMAVTSQHGRPDDGSDDSPFSNVELFAPLKPHDDWPSGMTKDKLTDLISADFQRELPGIGFNFSQYIQDNVEEAISGVKGENSLKIIGPNLDTLTKLANEARDQMAQVRGIVDLGIFPVLGQPNLNIRIDRAKAARYGVNTGDINAVIQAALGGATATTVLEGDRQFDVVVRYPKKYREDVQAIKNLNVAVPSPSGTNAYIPLSQLADISLSDGAAWIYHESTRRFIPIKFSVRDRDLSGAVAEAQTRIKAHVRLPVGYRYVWAGEFQDYEKAKSRLEMVSLVSFALIAGLLYSLFNNVRDSLLALAGIPQAIVGGILALYVTHQHFSISAAVGFVSLFGVSVMLGILIMSYYKEDRRSGRTPEEAMYHSAKRLLRPLLMTALSACIGLVPAATSTGIGSQVQRPLATVIVGGMLIGPILLLLAIPALRIIFPDKAPREPILSAEEATL